MSDTLAANISAVINLSASEVYRAWIDPDILPLWLAPPPYDMVRAEVDARVGGTYRHDVTGPDGDHVVTGTYLEITPSRHILKNWNYSGPNPAPRREATYVQVDLVEKNNGSTEITIKHYGLRDNLEFKHYQEGWEYCLKRLNELKKLP
jgi:uncharacterized protein YndB with AHSA1/START domain